MKLLESPMLTEDQFESAKTLADDCNQHESLDYLHPRREYSGPVHHFLAYADGKLTGYLAMHGTQDALEAYVVVDPQHRLEGIGGSLINAARESGKRLGAHQLLLVAEDKSNSEKAFAKAVGAAYSYSEYRMKLEGAPPNGAQGLLELCRVDQRDADLFVRLAATSFGDPIELFIKRNPLFDRLSEEIRSPTRRFYIARLGPEPIGCLGVVGHEHRVFVISLGVLPEYRGCGYGRQMLTKIANMLAAEDWEEVLLEVRTENRNALSLYRSCGFKETTSYNYYTVRF